ncbi:hypothetical protein RND81_06G106000 [Saponaria officinalis]|uniref:Uncharacterized protein n=1 Tax=Saponaria officinalis TaxID=3572 RepID=A0AAW1K574_SAPOF
MAEADKTDSSAGKAKSKTSFLDEDISKDFLSSWKSMSVTGGDDMDFSFEPVTKGKNKAFDFGMDMDFSLEDAFGKMPSFKLDMPDIDFSTSPKKSPKSNEKKSKGESAEGSRQDQNDKFTFSFDFNEDGNIKEMGEIGTTMVADGVPDSGAKEGLHLLGNRKTSIDVKSSGDGNIKVIGEFRTTMVADTVPDSGQAKKDGLHLLDNVKTSIDGNSSCDDSSNEGGGQRLHDNHSSCGKDSKELMKQDLAMEKMETSDDISRDDDNKNGRIRTKKDADSVSFDGQADKNKLHSLNNRKMTIDSKPSRDKEISFAEAFGKMPSIKVNMPHIDFSLKKYSKLKENLSDMESAKGNSQDKSNKLSSPLRLTKKISAATVTEEEKVVGVVEPVGDNDFNTVACSATNISKPMNTEVTSNAEMEISGLKDSPTRSDSEPTRVKPMSMLYQVCEANNFSKFRGTNDGAGTKHSIVERKKKGSTPLGAVDSGDTPSCEQRGPKLDDNPSSCADKLLKQESVEKRAKDADVSRDTDINVNGDTRTNMVVHPVPSDGQANKHGLHLLHNVKMSSDDKASSIRLPSSGAPKGVPKSSSQGNEKQGKISSMSTVLKSTVGQGRQVSRPPLARIDRTIPSLPSLRNSRNVTQNKQSSSFLVQDSNSTGNLEKSPRLQVKTKMNSPVNRTQTPLVPSLKRKPTEAADVHPLKRHSPSESRCRKLEVSAIEVENKVETQGTSIEGCKNVETEKLSPKFDFRLEANMENLGFTLEEGDVNVEKAEACAKELDDICSMLKKKHDEAKELLVRALVNNNNLLMLNHPICEEKIREVQRFASRLMSREQEAGV